VAKRRWADHEPLLAKALAELRQANSLYQAQVALNIMKVMVEHQAEAELNEPADHTTDCQPVVCQPNAQPRRRWYDTNQTLQSALQLLQDTPPDLQQQLIPRIAVMIEDTLFQHQM
jgi:hypothetical protein